MKRELLTLVFFCVYFFSLGQITYVTENQMSYDILHWHYNQYNNSTTTEWYKYTLDGELYYGVKFEFEGVNYESIYDANGSIVVEKKKIDKSNVDDNIIEVLDYRLVKYKIEDYLVETHFEYKKPIETFYRVDARTKSGGQVILWFDKEFNVLPQKEEHLAIR